MKRAFSLLELIVVIAIVALLMILIVPAMSSLGRSNSLNLAIQSVNGTLDLARQTAITQNRTVEVRLYKLPDDLQPTGAPTDYRGMQLFIVDFDTTNALTRLAKFSGPTVFSTNATASSLLDENKFPEQPPSTNVTGGPSGSNYRFRSFRFKPDGTADVLLDGNWTLTLMNKNEPIAANNLPANYATITLEPMTGKLKLTRP